MGGIIEVVGAEEAMAKVEATITVYIILLHKGMYLFLSVSMLNNHFKVVQLVHTLPLVLVLKLKHKTK